MSCLFLLIDFSSFRDAVEPIVFVARGEQTQENNQILPGAVRGRKIWK